jgi:hypothetical protein
MAMSFRDFLRDWRDAARDRFIRELPENVSASAWVLGMPGLAYLLFAQQYAWFLALLAFAVAATVGARWLAWRQNRRGGDAYGRARFGEDESAAGRAGLRRARRWRWP